MVNKQHNGMFVYYYNNYSAKQNKVQWQMEKNLIFLTNKYGIQDNMWTKLSKNGHK